jgi:hypothetical protein
VVPGAAPAAPLNVLFFFSKLKAQKNLSVGSGKRGWRIHGSEKNQLVQVRVEEFMASEKNAQVVIVEGCLFRKGNA